MNQRPSVLASQRVPALLQLDDIAPPCRRVLALVVVLDCIGKDIGLAFPLWLRILLTAKDNRFRAVHLVDLV